MIADQMDQRPQRVGVCHPLSELYKMKPKPGVPLLRLNLTGVAAGLALAVRSWRDASEGGDVPVTGEPFIRAPCLPVVCLFVPNAIWGALLVVRKRHERRFFLPTTLIWAAAVVVDFSHHPAERLAVNVNQRLEAGPGRPEPPRPRLMRPHEVAGIGAQAGLSLSCHLIVLYNFMLLKNASNTPTHTPGLIR